jgi:hypothetical protein
MNVINYVVRVEGSYITYRTAELHRLNEALCMLYKENKFLFSALQTSTSTVIILQPT